MARYEGSEILLSNGQVLVAGGAGNSNGDPLSSAELYNPTTGKWTYTGNLNVARAAQTATLLSNGKVLVVGGYGLVNNVLMILKSSELYDPVAGTWTLTGSMNVARQAYTQTLLSNGKVLVASGVAVFSQPATNTAELYS